MSNHFHLLLKEVVEGGISLFMQKVLTGYSMYFNKKYERRGALFANTFNSKYVSDDRYFKKVISYIHLNPTGLKERDWEKGNGDMEEIEKILRSYKYSSLSAFAGIDSPTNVLVSRSVFEVFDSVPTVKEMIVDARAYYQEQIIKVKP